MSQLYPNLPHPLSRTATSRSLCAPPTCACQVCCWVGCPVVRSLPPSCTHRHLAPSHPTQLTHPQHQSDTCALCTFVRYRKVDPCRWQLRQRLARCPPLVWDDRCTRHLYRPPHCTLQSLACRVSCLPSYSSPHNVLSPYTRTQESSPCSLFVCTVYERVPRLLSQQHNSQISPPSNSQGHHRWQRITCGTSGGSHGHSKAANPGAEQSSSAYLVVHGYTPHTCERRGAGQFNDPTSTDTGFRHTSSDFGAVCGVTLSSPLSVAVAVVVGGVWEEVCVCSLWEAAMSCPAPASCIKHMMHIDASTAVGWLVGGHASYRAWQWGPIENNGR